MIYLLFALKLCWINPVENVDGSTLTDLASINLYKDGQLQVTYAADAPGSNQCVTFRLPEGVYQYRATAVDSEGNESAYSNQVEKTETRLGGPSGGEVLQGPTDGHVITGEDNG